MIGHMLSNKKREEIVTRGILTGDGKLNISLTEFILLYKKYHTKVNTLFYLKIPNKQEPQ